MRLEIPKKIRAEEFKEADRDVASKIGAVYNSFVDNLYFLLNKNVGYDVLNRQKVQVTVTIGAAGKIVNPPTIKYNLNSKVVGTICINSQCLTNNQMFATGVPNINFELNNNTLILTNVTNLQANSQYLLTLELIGE